MFCGPARIFESQDEAVDGILGDEVKPGDVVIIRYEGPKGGPGMQEMLYPDELPEIEGAGQGLRADHGWALLRRHARAVDRPRLARGGGGWRDRPGGRGRPDRDRHPGARLAVVLSDEELAHGGRDGGEGREAWKPRRDRNVSLALRAYAALTTSASRGAVRDVSQLPDHALRKKERVSRPGCDASAGTCQQEKRQRLRRLPDATRRASGSAD